MGKLDFFSTVFRFSIEQSLTDLRGYESKPPSPPEQAWRGHGAQGWLPLRVTAAMGFGYFDEPATLEALCNSFLNSTRTL